MGFPHSEISGSQVATHLPEAYRSYATSFIAVSCQGILHTPLYDSVFYLTLPFGHTLVQKQRIKTLYSLFKLRSVRHHQRYSLTRLRSLGILSLLPVIPSPLHDSELQSQRRKIRLAADEHTHKTCAARSPAINRYCVSHRAHSIRKACRCCQVDK